jgi:hypothetical protein
MTAEYVLSEIERRLLCEIETEAQRAAASATAPFRAQSDGALTLIFRQQGLTGAWKLSDDKTRLVKQEN